MPNKSDQLTVSQFIGATAISRYQLADFNCAETSTSVLADGTKIATNSDGQLCQVAYSSGTTVRRHQKYVLVQTSTDGFWFGDRGGIWYPID